MKRPRLEPPVHTVETREEWERRQLLAELAGLLERRRRQLDLEEVKRALAALGPLGVLLLPVGVLFYLAAGGDPGIVLRGPAPPPGRGVRKGQLPAQRIASSKNGAPYK